MKVFGLKKNNGIGTKTKIIFWKNQILTELVVVSKMIQYQFIMKNLNVKSGQNDTKI